MDSIQQVDHSTVNGPTPRAAQIGTDILFYKGDGEKKKLGVWDGDCIWKELWEDDMNTWQKYVICICEILKN